MISLDEPYNGHINFVTSAAVTIAAVKRGVELNTRVYVVFNPNEAQKMEVDAVERLAY